MYHQHEETVRFEEPGSDRTYTRAYTHGHQLAAGEPHLHDYAWEGLSKSVTKQLPMALGNAQVTSDIRTVRPALRPFGGTLD